MANFACGLGGFSNVLTELGDQAIVVVASGAGYVVDTQARQLVRELNGHVTGIWFNDDIDAMIVTNGLWFEAFTANHMLWKSRRISWDGIRNLEFSALTLSGEAFSPLSDKWQRFEINLENGEALDGSYSGPPM